MFTWSDRHIGIEESVGIWITDHERSMWKTLASDFEHNLVFGVDPAIGKSNGLWEQIHVGVKHPYIKSPLESFRMDVMDFGDPLEAVYKQKKVLLLEITINNYNQYEQNQPTIPVSFIRQALSKVSGNYWKKAFN
jgi:hypothetical protein